MEIENIKKFNKFDIIICLILSGIIFFSFNYLSFLNDLLGEINLSDGMGFTENGIVTKPVSCNDYFFCRSPTIPYLYYYLLSTISIDFVIFLQIFFLVLATFLIRIKMINLNVRSWFASFIFFIIVFNSLKNYLERYFTLSL